MEQSPRLSLSYVMPAQAQKHVTVNESFRRLDALTQLTVLSRTLAAEPGAPAEGDAYILPASPTGTDWDNFSANHIAAFQDGAWIEIASITGLRAWISDESALAAFNGVGWGVVTGGGETALQFGVNTSADATNRFAVKSDAILFSHDDVTPGNGDCQIKVNKQSADDTASHLFQTGFSGRAEFGLSGDDDFRIKVSPNGSSWTDALWIDKNNGDIGVGTTAPTKKLHISSPDTNDGFVLETTNTASGRIGFDLVTGYAGNAGDYFRFNFRGDNPDLLLTVRDVSASAWHDCLRFDYLSDETVFPGAIVGGSPSGGGKGNGTINAQAIYDDNTLLSCYVFDQVLDGVVDFAKWDEKVPDRVGEKSTTKRLHRPLRKFAARIGGEHDPLTLDGYAKHWRERRHLTAMPNEAAFNPEESLAAGEWIQRLVETAEIQAVLIETLNQRLKAVEAERPPKRA